MPKIIYTVEAANARLKAANTRVALQALGGSLYLRATLPNKNGRGKSQQRIALGYPETEKAVRRAEAKATLLRAQLIDRAFQWGEWVAPKNEKAADVGSVVERFEKSYRGEHQIADRTWRAGWLKYFNQLDPSVELTAQLAIDFVSSKKPDTQTRRTACMRLQKLLDFAGINAPLGRYKGSYGLGKAAPRELPSEAEIAAWREKIPNAGWRWVYGMMAAFGLRSHEVFFCEFTDEGLKVLKGKTGPRIIDKAFYDLPPGWVGLWELKNKKLPRLTTVEDTYQRGRLGGVVYSSLKNYKIPFKPYDLRHAAAVRMTTELALPVTTSAAILGHDPDIHLKVYQRYIRDDQVKKSIERSAERFRV